MSYIRKHIVLFLLLVLYVLAIAAITIIITRNNGGAFNYVLDDAYIHLTLAKNFLLHGVPGINAGEFSASSSSLLWVILIAGIMKVTGINLIIPLGLNIFFSICLIIFLHYSLIGKYRRLYAGGFLLLIVIGSPLIPLVFTGLEHILHILVCVIYFYFASKYFEEKKSRTFLFLLFLSILMPLIRYESMFITFGFSIILASGRNYLKAMINLMLTSLPILIPGYFFIKAGGFLFPNPVILKGTLSSNYFMGEIAKRYFYGILSKFADSPEIIIITLALLAVLLFLEKEGRADERIKKLSGLYIISLFVFLIFGSLHWYYRYEAYIIATGIFVFALLADNEIFDKAGGYFNTKLQKIILIIIVLTAASPVIHRGYESAYKITLATRNSYDEQHQVARIIGALGDSTVVAMNDIGVASFVNNVRIIDLQGLGSNDVAKAIHSGTLNEKSLLDLLDKNKVDYVINFEHWFKYRDEFLRKWIFGGSLEISDNYICGDDKVSFFSRDSTLNVRLTGILKAMKGSIPAYISFD